MRDVRAVTGVCGREAASDGRRVFDALRELGWGRVEELVVAGGVPVIASGTKLFRRVRPDVVLAAAAAPDLAPNRRPHPRHLELLAYCRSLDGGVIPRVEVADGLPVFWR